MKYKKIKMLPEKQPFLNLNILRYLKIRWRENEKNDLEFSRNDLKKQIYNIAFDDIDDLYFAMQ
jgi:hypothetical protein